MTPGREAVRARLAVSVFFLVNGAVVATVLSRLPAIKAAIGLSNAELGTAIAFNGGGALISGTVAGWLVVRFGSGRIAIVVTLIHAAVLPLIALASGWLALAGTMFLRGASDGVADPAQNTHALRVQRRYRRSLINGFHAWWSLGGVAGGLVGAGAAALRVPLLVHFGVVAVALVLVTLLAGRWVLRGEDPGRNHVPTPQTGTRTRTRTRGPSILALGALSGVTLLAALAEDVPGSWSAVYLHDELGAAPGLAGLGFAAFTAGMTAGRLLADRAVDRWGSVTVVRWGGVLGASSLVLAVAVSHPWVALLGFALTGLGAAPAFPALFHAAGHRPGVQPGGGVALVSWSAGVGFFLAPALVGLVAEAVGLDWGILLGALAAAALVVVARVLRTPD